jgi:hypothetical protein
MTAAGVRAGLAGAHGIDGWGVTIGLLLSDSLRTLFGR